MLVQPHPFFIDSLPLQSEGEASASPLLAAHARSPRPTLPSLRLLALSDSHRCQGL